MKPIIYSIFDNGPIAKALQKQMDADLGHIFIKEFPDGETYLQVNDDVRNRQVILIDSLDHPNSKISTLLFFAETLKQEGAKQIGLVAPYLSYMRQDKQFHPGEGVTSKHFAKFISNYYSWLITVDPHLHRYQSMQEIYSIPTKVVHAAPSISHWIKENLENPILIGPDSESEQWVSEVAKGANAPYTILQKQRLGDREVKVSIPDLNLLKNKQPVLIDDIISTGATMIKTILHLKDLQQTKPICIGVHGIFAQNAYHDLLNAGASSIVTCDTIEHPSNSIHLSGAILNAILEFILL